MEYVKYLDGTTKEDIIKYLSNNRVHQFDIDIETLSYNMNMSKKKPTAMKSRMFTFTASWFDETNLITIS